MVSKLLLAVQENVFAALQNPKDAKIASQLIEKYYDIRNGLGFNKTPEEYGAFPTDPYSHTPKHAGASQPGMTGQVKEEIITRLGELGVFYKEGKISFDPKILRKNEFFSKKIEISILQDEESKSRTEIPDRSLLFTLCSIPIIYTISSSPSIFVYYKNNKVKEFQGETIDRDTSKSIFERKGEIDKIIVFLNIPLI